MSSDEEVLCVRKKKVFVGYSSDENEIIIKKDTSEEKDMDEERPGSVSESAKKYTKKKRRIKTFDSSSESDEDGRFSEDGKSQKNKDLRTCQQPKNEENNDFGEIQNESLTQDSINVENEKNEQTSEIYGTKKISKNLWYTNTDIYDAEGSSEEEDRERKEKEPSSDSEGNNLSDIEAALPDSPKQKKQKQHRKKEERKSKKKAQEEIKTEIHRESQRLMREVQISIPYHKPKQRSLSEFLVRRKSTPKVSLKTSSEQLVIALKEIEQREKEAELFYKSESSEDDCEIKAKESKLEINFENGGKCEKVFDTTSSENSSVLLKAEHTLSDLKITDCVSQTGSQKEYNVQAKGMSDTGMPVNEDCSTGMFSQDNNTTEEITILIKENIEQSDNFEKPRIVIEQTEISNTNLINEFKISEDKVGNSRNPVKESETVENEVNPISTSRDLISGFLPTNLEDKTKILSLNIVSSESAKPSQNKIDSKISLDCDIIKSTSSISASNNLINTVNTEEFSLKLSESQLEHDSSENKSIQNPTDDSKEGKNTGKPTECNTVNTEEFSLRLSESQSEYESTDKGSFQSSSDDSKIRTDKEMSVDSKVAEQPRIFNKNNEPENPGDKTSNVTQQGEKLQVESEQLEKIEQSDKESESENELYKKYNVDLKTSVNTPKITGSQDEVIDLDEGITKPEVHQLMKRFLTHLSYKKKPSKKNTAVELSIVSAERDETGNVSGISEEVVQVLIGEEEEEEDPKLARPGAKHARLRAQLQQQMERQREQEWAKRMQEQRLYEDEEVYEGEKDVCDGSEGEKEDVGDYEEKGKTGEEEEEEEEEEDDEEEEESVVDEDSETDEEITEKSRKTRNVFLDDEAEESDEEPYTKQSFKRNNDNKGNADDYNETTQDIDYNYNENAIEKIIEINEQSVEGGEKKGGRDISDFFIKRPPKMKLALPRTRTVSDMFSSEDILKYSTDEDELPSFQKPRPLDEKEDIEEKLSESPSIISPAFQLSALENMDGTNKYNWSEPSTPCKDFLSPKIVTPVGAIPNLVERSPQVCTQDLENMCSGRFTSQPLQETEENHQDFELFLAEDSQLTRDHVTPVKSSLTTWKSNSDGKDQMQSLLVDEEGELTGKVPCKKAKKLNFSDDEDDGDNDPKAEEESVSEDNDDDVSENAEVVYDSEENEVEVAKTAGEFLDAEAELSEDEWSSEDEDEQGLDALEMEEADKEKIDQRMLKRQLGQIHMKEMLKEDKKQVKLLQEMLLEDGELHSENKRQRLFRWSNNADFGEGDNKAMLDSDEEKGEEDEDEENWRKSRHERELFLQEHSKKEKLESLELEDSNSQLLRLGHKALKRLNSNSQEPRLTPPILSDPLASPDAKKPFPLLKRGSFLSRGNQALSRLAQMACSTSDGPIQQPKNSRNFVFTSISPTKSEQDEVKPTLVPNKRKIPHLPLPIAKKSCVQKSKTANKKSLFEALTRVHS